MQAQGSKNLRESALDLRESALLKMDTNRNKLYLIDGNSYCYRAFYGIRSLSNSKGFPTNAAYGFVTMLNKLIKEEKPDYLGIAFDMKGPTFRHKKLKEYKITRKPMPDDLVLQMPVIKELVKAYGIPFYEKEGFFMRLNIFIIRMLEKAGCGETGMIIFGIFGDPRLYPRERWRRRSPTRP